MEAFEDARAYLDHRDVAKGLTQNQIKMLRGFYQAQTRFLRERSEKGYIFTDSRVPLTQNRIYYAIKIPVAEYPTDDEVIEADRIISAFQSTLNMIRLRRVSRKNLLSVWRRFFNIRADWELSEDDNVLLRDQILGPGDGIEDDLSRTVIHHGNGSKDVVSVVSIKGFTRPVNLISTDFLKGDPLGNGYRLTTPSALIWTLHVPDQVKKRREIVGKSVAINWQAFGRMTKWSPRVGLRKKGVDYLVHAINNGENALECAFQMVMWSRSEKEAQEVENGFKAHAAKAGFTMLEERWIAFLMFMNSLPLFPDLKSLFMTKRLKSMGTSHAAALMPILTDWPGNSRNTRITRYGAGSMFASRRGHLVLFDIFASEAGYNFVLAGRTRSGKTVTAQQLLMDLLTVDAQVWVIEIGRGFEKLCAMFDGHHIDLRPDMDIGLNPFSVVTELLEEMDELVGIFGTMIDDKGELSSSDRATIKQGIMSVFGANGTAATPTHLAHWLAAQDNNPRAQEMSRMMIDFTENGAYGHWFNSPMSVNLNGRFVNLELKAMENRRHLMHVVLMQMMFAIAREISASEADVRRRVLFVDEASELLKIPTAAQFLEGLARRVAKSRGALGLGVQGIADLYRDEHTRAIVANTAHFIAMRQSADTIEQLQKDQQFAVGDAAYAMMKSIRKTAEYAEAFFYSDEQMGVARLVLDPYRRVLFATDGPEKEEVVADIRAGIDPDTAIQRFFERHPDYLGKVAAQIAAPEEEEDDEDDVPPPDFMRDVAMIPEPVEEEDA